MTDTQKLKAPALDPAELPVRKGSSYPAPFDKDVAGRERRALGNALGLKNFGVNLLRLAPGDYSSQRHWHSHEDEFIYIVEGEVVLVTDAGEQVLTVGLVAGFPAASGDGHCLINRSDKDALVLEVGDRDEKDEVDYPDIDLHVRRVGGKYVFMHKDGTPY